MILYNPTFSTPEENLACDEALLDILETQASETPLAALPGCIRFWSSPRFFVVLGFSKKVRDEVFVEACEVEKIPVLRRCSGGGTVLQGPGCWNYSLLLPLQFDPELETITAANQYIMRRQAQAVSELLGSPVHVRGHTDLCLGTLKFSGNAQRRKRYYLLFHGSFLVGLDFDLIERTLRPPMLQPEYRYSRTHRDFLTCLSLSETDLKTALLNEWSPETQPPHPAFLAAVMAETKKLVLEKYSRTEWNQKF